MTATARLLGTIETVFGERPPGRLGVAVSGGSDSLALLHLLHEWGRSELFVVTVNHGLRKDAASEALHVARLCDRIEVPHQILQWAGWDGKGNLQDQARRNRYSIISEWAVEHDLDAVALGHTLDDQAETLLMRLARGAGVDGLSGMASRFTRGGAQFVRPLLSHSREDLRAFLRKRNLRWVDDPSNDDTDFERVRMREALALLAPLGVTTEALSAVAANLAEARDALSTIAANFVTRSAKVIAGDLIFDRPALSAQPAELRRRLVAQGVRWISSSEYPPRRQAVDAALRVMREGGNTTLHGCRVMVSDMTVRITREHAAVAGLSGPTDVLWDARWVLDGPHDPALEVRALGEAVKDCPDWRATGIPRISLLASPAIWRGLHLVAAPLAGHSSGWTATTRHANDFAGFLILH